MDFFRGTTPYVQFRIPIGLDQVELGYFTIKQGDLVIERDKESWGITPEGKLYIHLSQEESLKLKAREVAEMQITLLTKDRERITSHIMKVLPGSVLKEGVIGGDPV